MRIQLRITENGIVIFERAKDAGNIFLETGYLSTKLNVKVKP